MSVRAFAFVATLLLVACAPPARDAAVGMSVVQSLDLPRYMGRWYEIARIPNSFEKGCAGVTADYALQDDGTIRVVNSCHSGDVDGPLRQVEGQARVVAPGKLKVGFVKWLPFAEGDYWLLDVAPDYSVAVVGAPKGNFGWILARSPAISPKAMQAAVAVMAANGYDTDRLELVKQGPAPKEN
jgi:apolipoprotein D and lipocalin family protein